MDTVKKYKLSKPNAVGLFVMLIINILGLGLIAANLAFNIMYKTEYQIIAGVTAGAGVLCYLFIIFFGTYGYKLRKFSILKSIMIFFALVYTICYTYICFKFQMHQMSIAIIIACLLVIYVTFRLHRFKETCVFATFIFIALILHLTYGIYLSVTQKVTHAVMGLRITSAISPLIIWCGIMGCYLATCKIYPAVFIDRNVEVDLTHFKEFRIAKKEKNEINNLYKDNERIDEYIEELKGEKIENSKKIKELEGEKKTSKVVAKKAPVRKKSNKKARK